MRILTFCDYYLPGYKAGGPIRTLEHMAQQLRLHAEFRIVTRDRDFGDTEPYHSLAGHCSVAEVRGTSVRYLSPRELSLLVLRRLLRADDHDVVYLNSVFSFWFSVAPLLLRAGGLAPRRPVVVAPRGEFSRGALALGSAKKRGFLAAARFLRLYRGVTWQASSHFERADILRVIGPDARVQVAPDLSWLPPEGYRHPPRRPKEAGRLRVIYLSRITPKKNLLHGLDLLREELPGRVDLTIVGPIDDAGYWRQCEEAIARLPANCHVHYAGAVEHERVRTALAEHDLFLFPTQGENFGHVVLESLLAGTPVLLSDQTPWRALAERRAGWDLPLRDADAFREALACCIRMGETEYGEWVEGAFQEGIRVSTDAEALGANRRLFESAVRGAGRGTTAESPAPSASSALQGHDTPTGAEYE